MMSKEFLKKLGVLGVSFGLLASPLTFAGFHEEEEQEPVPQEETAPDENYGSADDTFGTDHDATEYEDEEEEFEFEYEEENEEEEWEVPSDDDDDEGW